MSSIVVVTDPRVPLPPAELLTAGGNEAELLVGGMALLDLPRRLGLWSPDRPVVDIGCGDGRLAYGLLQKGQHAPYFGMDAATDRLGWLRSDLLPWLPAGSDIVEIPSGDDGGGTTLPWPSWQAGLVVLQEILTRSPPDKLARLLAGLRECLPVDAAVCANLYLLNQESRDLHMRRRTAIRFDGADAGADPHAESPSGAVAFDEAWLHTQVADAGLRVDTILYGGWCGRHGAFTGHDFAVLRRA